MAKLEFSYPVQFEQLLKKLSGDQLRTVCEKAVTAAGKVMLTEAKKQLKSVIGTNPSTERDKRHGSRSTGELVESIGVSPCFQNRKGEFNVKVGFKEPRQHKTTAKEQTNAEIANVLEHGRHGQPPRPFMKKAKNKAKKAALEEMERVFTEEVDKL